MTKFKDNTIIVISQCSQNIFSDGKEDEDEDEDVYNGIGFVVKNKNKNKLYVITAGHIVKDSKYIIGLKIIKDGIDVIDFQLRLVFYSAEFDIACLEFANKDKYTSLFPNHHI